MRGPLVAVLVLVLLLSGCREIDRLAAVAPRLVAPDGDARMQAPPTSTDPPPEVGLSPAQPTEGFAFERAGTDKEGRLLYRVRIEAGGSPNLVATTKLTPLFQVDGKTAGQYVADAYFAAHPGKTPRSIQPGDEFELALPADTFIVRWQEEREEDIGEPVYLREYVSERGDRLRFYLTDRFPIRYELEPADTPGRGVVHLHPDLRHLLRAERTDPQRLSRLVYRVPDPDILQVETVRRVIDDLSAGAEPVLEIDRTRTYLDPVREAMAQTEQREAVSAPDREHLVRAVFTPEQGTPFVAVEDTMATHSDLDKLPGGRVFRIEYGWNGTVRVSYKTGEDDTMGKRDPYQLRENERWAELYERLVGTPERPVKWGPGEPADMEPFPTARDPRRRVEEGERSFDYLMPNRMIVLAFRPIRSEADVRAQQELRDVLRDARENYRDEIGGLLEILDSLKSRQR
jgi:hypothetical protein